jgi:multidrug efflux pump subunit AcrB
MSVIKLALQRPYTFVVIAIMVVILGIWQINQTSKDIFPDINMPIVSIVWTYNGLTAEEFSQRITINSEIYLSNYVTGISRIESQTQAGLAIIRLFFHENVSIESAIGQATSICQTVLKRLPVGITPPEILLYSPSTVPVIQIVISSDTLTEEELLDHATYRIRPQVAALKGVTVPLPYGGKVREMIVDTLPEALQARGLSPRELNAGVNFQSFVLPTGDVRIGDIDYLINLNNTPYLPEDYNDIPIAEKNGSFIYISDVGYAHDGFAPQLNIVHNQGKPAILMTVLKNGGASTLDIVDNVRKLLPSLRAAAPKGTQIDLLFDQSIFVRAALKGVVIEGVLATCLMGILMFAFLESWRSTLIVIVIIPISILASILLISLMGYTLNLMTLGGFTMAIGILVDNAVVVLENIHRNLKLGKPFREGIMEGCFQVILPTFASTLAICIVFLPISLLTPPSLFLFVPFAFSVVFAVIASFCLAFTLLPVMTHYLERKDHQVNKQKGWLSKFQHKFEHGFDSFREGYGNALKWSLHHRVVILIVFGIVFVSPLLLLNYVGRDFFPMVDAGQIRLHVYLPTGTRIEVSSDSFRKIEDEIQKVIPPEEIDLIIDNVGIPQSAFNLAFGDHTTLGTWDGEILLSLKDNKSRSTFTYVNMLRDHLIEHFPDYTFLFQASDIISKVLNFGLPTPIDIQIVGHDENNISLAEKLVEEIATIPGIVDARLHQLLDQPELFLNVDRKKLMQVGLTQFDIANDIVISCSDSTYITPNFWLDRKMGIPYFIAVQTPKYRIDSVDALMQTPITSPLNQQSQLLSNLATLERKKVASVVNHYNLQPVFDIFANVNGTDLGSVAEVIRKIADSYQHELKPGNRIMMRGIIKDMNEVFSRLMLGFAFAFLLIYLILVINFQSWLDPFIIIIALLGVISGVVWMLFLTHTTFNVPSLMGSIVSLGVATANSVLVVAFANQQMYEKENSIDAVHSAAVIRLRPILMTALAMIVGTIPMALAIGTGGEQNAPLGRALIGGLVVATFSTLFFVPIVFSYFRKTPNPYLKRETK